MEEGALGQRYGFVAGEIKGGYWAGLRLECTVGSRGRLVMEDYSN